VRWMTIRAGWNCRGVNQAAGLQGLDRHFAFGGARMSRRVGVREQRYRDINIMSLSFRAQHSAFGQRATVALCWLSIGQA
jgi:hypothetical protein